MLLKRKWVLRLLLVLTDVVLINVAFALGYWMRYDLQWFRAVDPAFDVRFRVYIPFILILTAVLVLAYRAEGLYNLEQGVSLFEELYSIINGTTTGIVLMVVLVYFFRPLFYSRLLFLYAGAFIFLLLSASRMTKALLMRRLRQRGVGVARVLIVGAGEAGRAVMRAIVAQPSFGYKVVGFVDDNPSKGETDIGPFKALGSLDNLARVIHEYSIDDVFITLPWQYHRKIMAIVAQCEREQVRARIAPDMFQMSISRMDIITLAGIPLIGVKETSMGRLDRWMKRAIDFTVSLAALVFLAPILGLVALLIKLDSEGPVFFRQERVGKGGRKFRIYKFRSMYRDAEEKQKLLEAENEADGPIFKIRDDPRITKVGRWLRRFSIDELPQFYNVLLGDMSVIGPRPPLQSEVDNYQEWHKRRLEVSPGITGLWAISGRSELSFDEMALLDIYYIENWSPGLDTKIFFQTIPYAMFGRGAY